MLRLLDVKKETQSEGDEFPGGYVIYILMTFLPETHFGSYCGKRKLEFRRPLKRRSGEIKHSQPNLLSTKFLTSEVYRCGIMPKDEAIRSILWDEEGGRWFVSKFL